MSDELTFQSVLYGERKWRRVGEREHVTRGGRHGVLAIWESVCVVCDQPFRIEPYDRGVSQESNCFLMMTCREHRLWPYESMKIWLAKPEDRRAVFEEIKRKKLAFVARPRVYDPSTWRRRPKRKATEKATP